MKKVLPLLLLIAVAFVVTACKQHGQTPSPQSAADDFFQKISEARFQEAYDSTAFGFQAQTDFSSFQATAKELGLSTGTIARNWLSEQRAAEDVQLTGELLSATGSKVPVRLTLIRERKAWRVFALHTPTENGRKEEDIFSLVGKGSSFNSSANHALPSLKNLQILTARSLILFNRAAQQGDFADFYNNVSLLWQSQLTVTQLRQAFQPFIDSKADISAIQKLQPVFDVPPEISSEGILTLDGHYETTPHQVSFSLRFIFEFPCWKLYGIKVQTQD